MRIFRLLTLSLAVLAAVSASAAEVGTNLDAVVDFSAQYPFVDAFRQSRDWIPQNATVFDTNERGLLDLDADGWVKSIPATSAPPQFDRVVTLLFHNGIGTYPAGTYIVTFDGQGTIEYGDDAVKNVALSAPGRDVLTVATPKEGIKITILNTNPPPNYIRNIRVWMPGFDETTGPNQVFHPDFLAVIQPFTVLRFMDWMQTNNSPQVNFADRPRTTDARWTIEGKGVPLETMIELANRTQKDPWFNMPHKATNDYITQFATTVKNTLEANRKVYVEYSNEVWNSQFAQFGFVRDQAEAEFPGGTDSFFTKLLNRHGERTAQVCDLWQAAFGAEASRVECVLGAQAANDFTATEALDCPLSALAPCHTHNIDAVAIAPYFGGYLGDHRQVSIDTVDGLTLDQFFTEITAGGVVAGGPPGGAIAETGPWVIAHRTQATARGKDLISYEGGQHLVAVFQEDRENTALTALFTTANRDSRMGAAYTTYLNQWKTNGGELFVHFNNASTYTLFGSWGAVERLDQPNTPKNNALLGFIGGINRPPTANAGADRSVDEGSAVTLNGTGTDPEAGTLTFAWTQTAGPAVTPQNPTSATASFTAPAVAAQTPLTFRLRVTDEGALFDDDTIVVTVRDLGLPSAFAFSAASYTVKEAAGFATITVRRTGGTGPATVQYLTSPSSGNGAADVGDDFTAASGTLTFGKGIMSQTFKVFVTRDTQLEAPEALALRLQNPSAVNTLGSPSTAVLTIIEDMPVISFATPALSFTEGGPTRSLVVRRTGNLSASVGVSFTTSDGTATKGQDYSGSGTLEFAPMVTSQTITVAPVVPNGVRVIDDATPEGPETFKVTLEAGVPTLVKTATITIVDNDQGLAFSAPTFTVAETRPTAVISVRRTGGLTGTLVVNFATSPGTAVPGTDYTDTAGSLTFPPGVAIKTFSVPILNDTSNDGSRTVFLALTGVTPATVVKSPGTAVLTITDNEPVFQFALPAITVSEASGRATITVRRTARSAEITGVDYVVSGGTATNGTDYTLEAGTLTFFPNELVKTFSVTITNDGVDEPNETVLISLKENTGAATPTGIGTPGTTTLTITDNDVAGKIRFSAATYSVLESAGAATITLTRTGGTSNAATVIVTLAGGSASNGTHYTNAGPILVTFAANQASQSFPIAILSDGPTDSSNFITLTLGPFSGGALPGTITRADLWIVDAN